MKADVTNSTKDIRVGPLDLLWHLLNFFAPAAGVALTSAIFAKMCWRRELKNVAWRRLAAWSMSSCAIVLVSGLVVFGHDGKMATYGVMVSACALSMWWVGFRPRA